MWDKFIKIAQAHGHKVTCVAMRKAVTGVIGATISAPAPPVQQLPCEWSVLSRALAKRILVRCGEVP